MLPVVYLHGAGLDATVWSPFQTRLGGVTLDLPGRGGIAGEAESMEEMARVVSAEIPENAVVVGHSMGGAVALELARLRPVGGLVLISTGARLRVSPVVLDAVDAAAKAGLPFRFVPGLLAPDAPEELVRCFESSEARVPVSRTAADWHAVDRFDRRAEIPALPRIPTWVIVGDDDVLTPPRYADWLVQRLPGARQLLLRGGHLAAWEQLDVVVATLQPWLKGLPETLRAPDAQAG